MKKISKILAILSVFVLALSLNTYAKQKTYLFVDGNHIKTDAEPFIENGRTLVPIRFISENLKNKVDWNSDEKKVTVTPEEEKEISKIELVIGSDVAKLYDKDGNIKEEKLEVPAKITNSRTFVPVRFISETLGTEVNWDPENRVVIIGDKTKYNSEKFKNEVIAKEPKEKQEPVKKQETKKVAKTNTKTKEFNYGGEKYVPTYTQNRVEVFKKIDKILGVKRDKDGWGRATKYEPHEKKNKEFWFAPLNNDWTKNKSAEECFKIYEDRLDRFEHGSFEIPLEAKYLLIDLNKDALNKYLESGYNIEVPKEVVVETMSKLNNREAVKTDFKLDKYDYKSKDIWDDILWQYIMGITEDTWSLPAYNTFRFTTFHPDRDIVLNSRLINSISPLLLFKGNVEYSNERVNTVWSPVLRQKDLTKNTTLGELIEKYPGNINMKDLFVDKIKKFLKIYSKSGNNLINKDTIIYKNIKNYPEFGIKTNYRHNLEEYYLTSTFAIKLPGETVSVKTYIINDKNSFTFNVLQGAGFSKPYKDLIRDCNYKDIGGNRITKAVSYYGGTDDKIVGVINDVDIYIPTMNEVWDK